MYARPVPPHNAPAPPIPRGGGIGQVRADGFHSSVYGFAGIGFWAPEPAEVEGVMGEGMNEKGLTVSALSFNSQGAYEAPGSGKPALACVDVVPYLLGSAKNAAEAVALLRGWFQILSCSKTFRILATSLSSGHLT